MPSSEGGDITGSDHLGTVTPLDYILTEIKGNDGGFQRNFFFLGILKPHPTLKKTKPNLNTAEMTAHVCIALYMYIGR
jgi:hypothetical protein